MGTLSWRPAGTGRALIAGSSSSLSSHTSEGRDSCPSPPTQTHLRINLHELSKGIQFG